MARGLWVSCINCDFTTSITEGGTMASQHYDDPAPAYCADCRSLVSINLQQADATCPNCGSGAVMPYGSSTRPSDTPPRRSPLGIRFRDDITQGVHICPKCQSYGLTFSASGLMID